MSYMKNIMAMFGMLLVLSGLIMIIYDTTTKDKAISEKKDTTKMVSLTVPISICIILGICCIVGFVMLHNYELKHAQDHLPINERRLINNIIDDE